MSNEVLITTKIIDDETRLPLGTEIASLDENGVNNGIKTALECFGLTYKGVQAFGNLKDTPFDDSKEEDYLGNKIYNFFTPQEIAEAKSLVSNSCGLILPGGKDTRAYEILLTRIAYEKKKPILAICAGQNVLVRALGGTTKALDEEGRKKHWTPDKHKAHKAFAVPGTVFSKFMGGSDFTVNSVHSTVIDNPGKILQVLAYDEDKNIEVVGLPTFNNHFVLGTRFHPESFFMHLCENENPKEKLKNTIGENAVSLAAFGEFVKACERARNRDNREQ